jgi:hypothetical protein
MVDKDSFENSASAWWKPLADRSDIPQLSVIIGCHNQATFIEQAVKSPAAQSNDFCEVI